MNKLVAIILILFSANAFADTKNVKRYKTYKPNPDSIFDVIPLNSPVKESTARFLIKTPDRFDVEEVSYQVKNSGRIFERPRAYQKINLVEGQEGKELRINVSKLPPGFYQLLVKIKDQKRKEHEYKNKYKDHVMFVIDESLQVPIPNPKLNDKTIAGIDSDNDGIRDDIQRWINEEYADKPKVKMAIKQVAMGMQLQLLSAANREQSVIITNKVLNDLTCLSYTAGVDQKIKVLRELKSKLLNTKDRHYAKIKSSANFSGEGWELPNTPEKKKALCAFNPDSL